MKRLIEKIVRNAKNAAADERGSVVLRGRLSN